MKNISELSEEDIKNQYITPALEKSGWKKEYMRMEYSFTDGQILIAGNVVERGKQKKADYLLRKNGEFPIAVVEAKKLEYTADSGLQQAIDYATILHVPFAYASNGKKFIEHDFLTGIEREIAMDEFPTEEELWKRYCANKKFQSAQEKVILTPDHYDPVKNKIPRYYQRIAIDSVIQAVAEGQKRLLLVMATGTGKTFTAFQIVWKLLKSRTVRRVLYLADRNILIDQTMAQDFKPLEKVMCKIQNKHLDSSYEVFMSLYHQLAGEDGDEPFRQFKPEFFDLIIVDECHRGSAKADSEWRKILDYFSDAIHIGLTATPKETTEVSNKTYFGEPIYTYSLKQGILDGFLAPYKVIRVNLDKDLEGWRPPAGKTDIDGKNLPDKTFRQEDFDSNLYIEERTKLVARRITEWLRENGQFSKTIVFCRNTEHADRMRRALANENAELMRDNPRYVMKITGDDDEGKRQLEYFIEPDATPPIIATTAELLSTGVDCKTVKLIVIDKEIESMISFKQIIGRGTRLFPAYDKNFFTIMDFRGVTDKFYDPDFDGDPAIILSDSSGGSVKNNPVEENSREKFHVRGVDVEIVNEAVSYLGKDGKLITENLIDYTRKNILGRYSDLKNFLQVWNAADKKQAILDELTAEGIFLAFLRDAYKFDENIDDFDLILHVAYGKKIRTRRQRAGSVKNSAVLKTFSEKCRAVLNALLDKYSANGIDELENLQVLKNAPFDSFGSPKNIVDLFGGKKNYLQAVRQLKDLIYEAA
ncbi:MAG: DEAD/DEAH box helicase family protein [Selenomonadaceae bacterium]|nr:DEAD/DEAH box helicase family protein [Selenomonadaceae bacterium]MBR1647961.1 DEAD/DEAH box helicase family protein [Selenomonadaceae bacterium]